MGRKRKVQALLAALIATPLSAQDNLLVNGGFQQGLAGWYESGPGGVYDGCGPAGGYCYVFSYATGVVQQTVTTQANYTGFIVGFEYRLPCNNNIGGWCQNPNGPVDWLTASLNLYLGAEPVQAVSLLNVQTYQPNYSVFSLSGTASAFNTATITFTGQDVGFWAGPYGPQIDRVSLSFQNAAPLPQEPAAPVPDAVNPAPDVTPDATPDVAEEVAQSEPAQETQVEDAAQEDVVVTEAQDAVSDDNATQEDTNESQTEDTSDEPLSPDQLAALAVGVALSATEVAGGVESAGVEAQPTEAASAEQSAPEQNAAITIEMRRDRNIDFFQREALEEADIFPRETVLHASLQSVAFVAQADAQYAQQYGEQTTTETAGATYSLLPIEGPTFTPTMTSVIGDTSTPIGQSQQIELLGMQAEMAADRPTDIGDVNSQDSETMAQLAATPAGYSAYTQARIPDIPFYQPRSIYRGRRIPDANLALYRMMRGQDSRWEEMVEDQYE